MFFAESPILSLALAARMVALISCHAFLIAIWSDHARVVFHRRRSAKFLDCEANTKKRITGTAVPAWLLAVPFGSICRTACKLAAFFRVLAHDFFLLPVLGRPALSTSVNSVISSFLSA